jgi:hypothetical protein
MSVGRGNPTHKPVCTHDASMLKLAHTKSESGISCKRVSLCKNWNYSQSCDVEKKCHIADSWCGLFRGINSLYRATIRFSYTNCVHRGARRGVKRQQYVLLFTSAASRSI